MSFANEIKTELAHGQIDKKCCQLAEIAGFIRVSGSISLKGLGKFRIIVTTENPASARHIKALIGDYFDIQTNLEVAKSTAFDKSNQYSIIIEPDNKSEQILRETGILQVKEGYDILTDGIYDQITKKKCCKKAYLKGMFLGTGTINNPEKGYSLEIVCGSERLAQDLKKLMASAYDVNAKINPRKGKHVVYIKNFDGVVDTLTAMGAHSQVLTLQNTKIQKESISKAIRMVNVDSANIDRTMDAALKQMEAIKKIDLNILPAKLEQVARLRLENPEASLTQIGEMCDPKINKSGVYKRMNKIIEIAERY
ncbi:MAG: DNA-binding protein WhiA [Clostridia bacterium]|nr:DNA-binding protein WhiA [Clostridia bacterium]